MATDTGGNVVVDYVWGNMPPQPDTNRATALDGTKGFHLMLKTAYNGFPNYTPEVPYLDSIANVAVPDVVGELAAAAQSAIEAAALVYAEGDPADNAAGATEENDGTVKTQSPAAGDVVNEGDTVTVSLYSYTAVVPSAPTELVATPGSLSVSIAFTEGYDGGSPITNYEYTLNDGVLWVAFDPAVTASPVVISPLPAVETTVKLRAVNAVGAGAESAAVTFTPAE